MQKVAAISFQVSSFETHSRVFGVTNFFFQDQKNDDLGAAMEHLTTVSAFTSSFHCTTIVRKVDADFWIVFKFAYNFIFVI